MAAIYNNTRFKTASNKKYYFSVDLDTADNETYSVYSMNSHLNSMQNY